MRSNYKTLGNYIKETNERNKELKDLVLLGVSIEKKFIPSIANTIGTNMSTYKIVKRNQFAYGPVTSRNSDKISIALLDSYDEILISQSYRSFKIIDENELMPEYLMMWFTRPEFDRYARFMSHGSTRETYDWNEMCNTRLPIPSIEKQSEIVRKHKILQEKISLNNTIIEKMEELAQTIYKQWFVDFDFPDEDGNLYKSSNGSMVFNKELNKEIPKKWKVSKLSSFCDITSSRRVFEAEYKAEGVPFYRGGEIVQKKQGIPIKNNIYISEERYEEIIKKTGKPNKGDILLTAVGSLGVSYLVSDEKFYFKDGNLIWFKNFNDPYNNSYIYDYFQSVDFKNMITEITIGSTQNAITIKSLSEQNIIEPPKDILKMYKKISITFSNYIQSHKDINIKTVDLIEVLLTRLPGLVK